MGGNQMVRSFAPTSYATTIRNGGAMRQVTLRHREYVTDVMSDGTGTQILNYQVNPGLHGMFPWLSQIANAFESYVFQALRYVWVPVLSASTDGVVAFCPDYDAGDPDGEHSKSELLSFQDSVRGNLWTQMTMTATASNLKKRKQYFVRAASLPDNLDIKSYDTAQLNVLISDDKEDGTLLGEIWVEYVVTMYTPQLNHEDSGPVKSLTFRDPDYTNAGPTTRGIFALDRTASSIIGNMYGKGGAGKPTIPIEEWDLYPNPPGAYPSRIDFLRPGIFLLEARINQLSQMIQGIDLTIDSDTGDVELDFVEEVFGDNDDYSANWIVKCGNLTSRDNPVSLTDGSSEVPAATGVLKWNITELAGYGLPIKGHKTRPYVPDPPKKRLNRKDQRDNRR